MSNQRIFPHKLHHQRRIHDILGNRTDLIERGGKSDEPMAGNASICVGFKPTTP